MEPVLITALAFLHKTEFVVVYLSFMGWGAVGADR